MTRLEPDADQLLDRASHGNGTVRQQLLTRHRDRLRAVVAARLDRRLAARLDPSDIVPEALAEAARRLDDYLRDRPLPFYPWLRQLAWDRLVKAHRAHLAPAKRSVRREEPGVLGCPMSRLRNWPCGWRVPPAGWPARSARRVAKPGARGASAAERGRPRSVSAAQPGTATAA
jgi:hypothetical protein